MSFTNLTHVLASQLADAGTVNIDYPDGTDRGDFYGAFDHRIVAEQKEYKAPNDFTITLNASNFTVTWNGGTTLAAGTILKVQLDRVGRDSGRVLIGGVEVPNATPIERLHLNLGSPGAADVDAIVASVTPAAGGEQTLTLTSDPDPYEMDRPRNVTITSVGDESGRTFTVTGEDVYGKTMVEEITGVNASTANGLKAFAKVTEVKVDDDTAGAIEVGIGTVLGLPVFISDTDYVAASYVNGSSDAGTTVVGDTDEPTATTGDVRGTYDPSSAPDGSKAFEVIVDLPGAGYLGAEQYAG